ncbi:MAG: hypothetical protein OEV79_01775 [candidate division WOR-3 bacterium]|nr:hypothetical protein [candidate division WOR-3 bacterium]
MKYLKFLFLVFLVLSFCGRPEVEPETIFTIIGECPLPGYAEKVELVGDLAYVADGQGGLQIVDISNPESTSVIGNYVPYGWDANAVAVRDTFAYVAMSPLGGGLLVLSIADPTSPYSLVQDGSFSAYDVVAPAADTAYVYIAAGYWFYVWDITFQSYTRRLKTYGDVIALQMVDTLAYLSCEQMGMWIFNLASPDTLPVGWIDTPANARSLFINGNQAYVADGRAGLIIIDIADPAHPVIVGEFDTRDYANEVCVSGDKAYVADGDGGLFVIDVSNPEDPVLYGSLDVSYANGIAVRNDTIFVADRDLGLLIIVEEE